MFCFDLDLKCRLRQIFDLIIGREIWIAKTFFLKTNAIFRTISVKFSIILAIILTAQKCRNFELFAKIARKDVRREATTVVLRNFNKIFFTLPDTTYVRTTY